MMIYLILFLFCFCLHMPLLSDVAFTNAHWPGRLGDQIYYFSKCVMLSKKYNIPFYYRPFTHYDQFKLSTELPQLTPEIQKKFAKKVTLPHEAHIPALLKKHDSILITIEYHTKTFDGQYDYWRSTTERFAYITSLLTPHTTRSITVPNNHISVAVHVRKGGGYDAPLHSQQLYSYTPGWKLCKKKSLNTTPTTFEINYNCLLNTPTFVPAQKRRLVRPAKKNAADIINPKRFPPDQYYIECIKKLSELVNHHPLYIQIFTDDPNPQAVVERFKKQVNIPTITWHTNQIHADYKHSVLDDLLAISQCDCLIKGDSYFAWSAQFLGNHRLVFFPNTATWHDQTLMITKIGIIDCTQPLHKDGEL